MTSKRITLDLAEFLDSPQARSLTTPGPEDPRRILTAFLGACYEGLGKEPRLLDDHDMAEILTRLLPGRLKRRDPLAPQVPEVLHAFVEHLEATRNVPQIYELRRGLDASLGAFREAVRTGAGVTPYVAPPPRPIVERAPKLGRNDPCFCGSGKKFKKCHGRQGGA